MEIDKILKKCGDFHRYQFMLLSLFCIVNVLSSMHYYTQTIISFVPEHWCSSDFIQNSTIDEIRKIYSKFPNPSCTKIDNSSTFNISNFNTSESFSSSEKLMEFFTNENDMKQCNKWIYNHDHGYVSMTAELNWVCQNAWKSALGQSTFFIGSVFGTLIFGILADIVGRIPVLIMAHMMGVIGNGLTIFTTDIISFSICRLISGFATDTNFVMMYILVLEYIKPEMRTIGLNLTIGIWYCLGSVASPWLAVWLGNWKLYLIATILPTLVVPFFYFLIPESAQWLISKGKIEEGIASFRRIAEFNKRKLDDSFVNEFKESFKENSSKETSKSDKGSSMIGLFKTPRLRKLTLILFFKSMVITLCYDAISKNVEGLGLSPFVMFSLSASAIFPACLVLLALQDKIGRKAMASSSLLLSGIFTAGTGIAIVYQKGYQDAVLLASLSMVGRFGVTVAYNSGAQYATELIPTCVRGQGVAAVHVAGYGLTFFSSYILYLANIFKPLPSLILGILSLSGAFLCLFLPETLNRPTPITLEDGEHFGENERFFDFACFDKPKSESKTTLAS